MRYKWTVIKDKVGLMIERNLIEVSSSKEDYEIIKYGLQQCVVMLLHFLTAFLSGIIWGNAIMGVFLYMWIFILRPYTGGFHADTKVHCYLISLGAVNFVMMTDMALNITEWCMVAVFAGAALIIWHYSPVEVPQKPLNKSGKQVYSRRARQIILVYFGVAILSMFLKIAVIYKSQFWSMIIVAALVLAGKWKYRKKSNRKNEDYKMENTVLKDAEKRNVYGNF